jgi:uncharacterized protein with LGFP repeats
VPSAGESAVPRPPIVSRAAWGADESLVVTPNEYGQSAKVVFVHHTDTGNDYSCTDSAALVRSIFLYHVKTNGWNDIGYNFLVDKCGTLFEGRSGGVDRPVIGAHSYGFNTDSTGVAVLGTFTSVAPPQAALDTVARVAAWKLGLTGADPTGTTTLVEGAPDGNFTYHSNVTFHTISGHRDANSTECPGQFLYDELGSIRAAAAQWMRPANLASVLLSGATAVNGTYYTKSTVTLSWPAAGVSGYELLDDGSTVARPTAADRSATVTLRPGTHRLQLRATNLDGTTAASPAFPVTVDATKPVFQSPTALTVRTGTAGTTVPVRLTWKATDDRLLESAKATSPSAATFTAATTSWSTSVTPGSSRNWSLAAADAAGNVATTTLARATTLMSESSATRTGTWHSISDSRYLGGKGLYSTANGATASWTFTGRSAGLIAKRGTGTGKVYVYVDGTLRATIDTKTSTTLYRQIQWTTGWSTSARHTIKIKVAGTSGRATIAIDGIAVVN